MEAMLEHSEDSRKRLFIGLITGTSVIVCICLFLLWYVPVIGLANLHPAAPWGLGVLVGALILLVLWSGIGLSLSVALGKSLPFTKRLRGLTIKLFLPVMILLGRLVGINKEKIRNSFIKVNNELVATEGIKAPAKKILMLLPHCLQSSTCGVRLTYDINKCKRCGKCPIDGLIDLAERRGVEIAIATGGTIARRIVVQKRPRIILAVACERDLSSGIQDTYPIPVFGVLNDRPHGPCLDTLVSIMNLEHAIDLFVKDEDTSGTHAS
ncbi:DUF116 domain-containing protein [Desulfovibrio inopinatus]|uniref:DUF116 domain-containing protein n=1 Tax=Desulfovibrio inopinatus TaxID=102109 RepID=UPI00068578A0|nr:DUF116 domain-containing protein [Desulfovibrio inopinatus]